jgi:hypothetical protein
MPERELLRAALVPLLELLAALALQLSKQLRE